MAIITEFYGTRKDNVKLYRTYSNSGRTVVRDDGTIFDEAIDIENRGYIYVEGEPISEFEQELSAEETLDIILGGETS